MKMNFIGESGNKYTNEIFFLCKYLYELNDEGFEEKEIVYIMSKVIAGILEGFGFSEEIIDFFHNKVRVDFKRIKEERKNLNEYERKSD